MELEKFKEALRIDKWFSAVANLLNALTRAFVIIALILYFVLSGPHGLESNQRYNIILWLILVLAAIIVVEALLSLHHTNPLGAPGERPYRRSLNRQKSGGTNSQPAKWSKSLKRKAQASAPGAITPSKKLRGPTPKQLPFPKQPK